MTAATRLLYLVPLRLFCGWVFLHAGLGKLMGGWLTGSQLHDTVGGWVQQNKPYAFYAPFLHDYVLPHARLFSYLVSFGELLVGAALLVGLFTRWAALAGMLLVGSFFLGRGDDLGINNTAPFLIMVLTLALTHPGRVLGLDAALQHRSRATP